MQIPADIFDYIEYDPATGNFTQKVAMGPVKAGAAIGFNDARGYRIISFRAKHYFGHRLAWLWAHRGEPMPVIVDHINCETGDNRLINLRAATHSQNTWNQRRSKNPHGKCVYWFAPLGKFGCRFSAHKKRHFLGYFDTAEEAQAAHRAAIIKYHGEFARTE